VASLRDRGYTYQRAADLLGWSVKKTWQRYMWHVDYHMQARLGIPPSGMQVPPMRGTAACPRGSPYLWPVIKPAKPRKPRTPKPPPGTWADLYGTVRCQCGVMYVRARGRCPQCGESLSGPRD
jgi:hypothetical protein